MNGNLTLFLVYEPATGKPLAVARVDDRPMVFEAARAAINKLERRVKGVTEGGGDEIVRALELEEVNRLRRVLALVLPQFQDENCGREDGQTVVQ